MYCVEAGPIEKHTEGRWRHFRQSVGRVYRPQSPNASVLVVLWPGEGPPSYRLNPGERGV